MIWLGYMKPRLLPEQVHSPSKPVSILLWAVQYRLNRGAGEIFSLAAIDTVYQLIDFRPGVVNPENYRILAQIAYGRYSRKVKQHARNALRGLSERKSGIERSRQ